MVRDAFLDLKNYLATTVVSRGRHGVDVNVRGFNPIGLAENFLMVRYPDLELQLDCGDEGKDFIDRELDISYWVENGVVTSISIYPEYDDIEQVPRWPSPESS